MAIAPFIQPTSLGIKVQQDTDYHYSNGSTIIVQAYVPVPEDTKYNQEFNISPDAYLSWNISPAVTDIGTFTITDINGGLLNFQQVYPASQVTTIVVHFTPSDNNTDVTLYNLANNLFTITVDAYPNYQNGDYTIGAQAQKKGFATAPLKLFLKDYLTVPNQKVNVQNLTIKGINTIPLSGVITSDNNTISFDNNTIRNDFQLTYKTPGIKNIFVTLYFPSEYILPVVKLNYLNVLDVKPAYEDYTDKNTLRFAKQLPAISATPPYIAPNEFVYYDNINNSLAKIYDAIEFVIEQSKIVKPILAKRLGWFDTNTNNWNYYIDNINLSQDLFQPAKTVPLVTDVVYTDNEFFAIKENAIYEYKKDYKHTLVNTIKGFNNFLPFTNVSRIAVDSNKKLFVLDRGSSKIGIFKKNFTRQSATWMTELFFGGVGARATKNKFLLPNSIYLDGMDNLFVVDTGNNCIKKFTNDGTWQANIGSNLFANNIIDGAVDNIGHHHVLLPTKVALLDEDGTTLRSYNLFNPTSVPFKLFVDPKRDFIHVVYIDKIQKYYKNGTYVATIYGPESVDDPLFSLPCQDLYGFYWSWDALSCALQLDLNQVQLTWYDTACNARYKKKWMNENELAALAGDYDYNIYSAGYDPSRNLYIAVGGYYLKFLGNLNFVYLADKIQTKYYWNKEDILINKEDLVQDWVYNRSFQRLWDNIEVVRAAIAYKFNVGASYKATPFTFNDLNSFKFVPKDDIFFGQNEVVTTDVVNRLVGKLWSNAQTLITMVNWRQANITTLTLTATNGFTQTIA